MLGALRAAEVQRKKLTELRIQGTEGLFQLQSLTRQGSEEAYDRLRRRTRLKSQTEHSRLEEASEAD